MGKIAFNFYYGSCCKCGKKKMVYSVTMVERTEHQGVLTKSQYQQDYCCSCRPYKP